MRTLCLSLALLSLVLSPRSSLGGGVTGDLEAALRLPFNFALAPSMGTVDSQTTLIRTSDVSALEAQSATLPQCFEVDPSPLPTGDFWIYVKNGLNPQTETVLPGFFSVNSAPTQVIEISGGEFSGSRIFRSRDETGAKTHRTFTKDLFIEGFGFVDRTVTFSPPITWPRFYCVDDFIENDVTGFYSFSEGTTFTLNISSTSRVIGYEDIGVPFGDFTTLKDQGALHIFGTADGTPVDLRSTDVNWRIFGVGNGRREVTENSETDVFELVDTNRTQVPEPSVALMQISSLVAVLFLRRVRVAINS